jgi:hypothetical protein
MTKLFISQIKNIDLTYSSVSHTEKATKSRMEKEYKFRDYIEDVNSQFKV